MAVAANLSSGPPSAVENQRKNNIYERLLLKSASTVWL